MSSLLITSDGRIRLPRLTLLVICAGCSSRKTITIADERGQVTLQYDCSRFESKVKTDAETHVLLQKTAEIIRRASAEDNNALTRSLQLARRSRDILRLTQRPVFWSSGEFYDCWSFGS